MTPLEKRELTALRQSALLLTEHSHATPADVVRWMGAMQAQDFTGVKWAVGLRSPGSTDASIEAALARGEIVRSWPMRGTLHLVAPEDLGWMLAISRPRVATAAAKRRDQLEISDREVGIATDVAIGLLQGGRTVRRDDLLAAFEAAGVATSGQRAYHLLFALAIAGVTVFGPVDGNHQTFALLDEWVTQPRELSGDEALAEFASRYFRSHAPATERDFAWWASITLGDARKGIAAAGLEQREIDGATYYLAQGGAPSRAPALALPGFDEYLLGYQDRAAVLAPQFANRIVPGNNGVFQPTLIVGGQVVGTWRRTSCARGVEIEFVPFEPLTSRVRSQLERAIKRYSEFVGKPVAIG